MITVSWTTFKGFVDSRGVSIQCLIDEGTYHLRAFDGVFQVGCTLAANSGEIQEYTSGYASGANQALQPRANGVPLARTVVTKTGWHFEPRCIVFTSSKAGSLHNHKADGFSIETCTAFTDAVLKFYKSDGTQLTKGGEETDEEFQGRLDTDCTCTLMDWQPQYDMEILRGRSAILDAVSNPSYAYVHVAPDLPEIYGGNVPFMNGGLDLRFLDPRQVVTFDGAGSKFIAYDPVYNTNKFRLKRLHGAGEKITFQVVFEHFKA